MCIAIYKPAGVAIPHAHLVESQRRNSDGCGMAWVEHDEIQIFKSMDFDVWCEKYYEVLSRCGEIDMLIHFRITSRGKTDETMCHPFMIGEDMALIHNGTISNIKAEETKNGDSDTKFLAEQILANLPEGWEYNQAIQRLIEHYVGWSKLVVMTRENNVYIYNESSGLWADGIWYSNKTYEAYVKPDTSYYNNSNSNHSSHTRSITVYSNGRVDRYDDNGRKVLTDDTAGTKYVTDYCDKCYCEFPSAELNYTGEVQLCDKCFREDLAKTEARAIGTTAFATGCTVYRPCGCCRTLTDKTDLFHVEVEFNRSLNKYPEQLNAFQRDLVKIKDGKDDDLATLFMCEECYMVLMQLAGGEEIYAMSILEYPENFDENATVIVNE